MKNRYKGQIFSGIALALFGAALIATGFGVIPGATLIGVGIGMTCIGTAAYAIEKNEANKKEASLPKKVSLPNTTERKPPAKLTPSKQYVQRTQNSFLNQKGLHLSSSKVKEPHIENTTGNRFCKRI